MMRVDAFREVGAFDASVAAGEEPELCQRLREKGHRILRIDAEMTLHDADILRFGQWWKRAVRGGYGATDVATRFGGRGLFVKQVQSARLWAVHLPLTVAVIFVLTLINYWSLGAGPARAFGHAGLWAGLVALAWPLQAVRLAFKIRRRVPDWKTAIAYGALTMIGKFASVMGQHRYRRDRAAGRNTRLIEYKNPCPTPITKPT